MKNGTRVCFSSKRCCCRWRYHKDIMDKVVISDHIQFRIETSKVVGIDINHICLCFDLYSDKNVDDILDNLRVNREPNKSKIPRYFTASGEGSGKQYLENGKIMYNNKHTSQTVYINNDDIRSNITVMVDLLTYLVQLW